jgi:hypothetical protein
VVVWYGPGGSDSASSGSSAISGPSAMNRPPLPLPLPLPLPPDAAACLAVHQAQLQQQQVVNLKRPGMEGEGGGGMEPPAQCRLKCEGGARPQWQGAQRPPDVGLQVRVF